MISGQYACILTFHISKAALPYNIMTVVSFEVEKYIENPMLTNSNTQRRCKLNGDFTNRKHTDTSYLAPNCGTITAIHREGDSA